MDRSAVPSATGTGGARLDIERRSAASFRNKPIRGIGASPSPGTEGQPRWKNRRLRNLLILCGILLAFKAAFQLFKVDLYRAEISSYMPFFWSLGGNSIQVDRHATAILQSSLDAPAPRIDALPVVPAKGKNVIFLLVESLRADALDPETMPFLDSLGRAALVSERHHSTANSTPYAVESILSGAWPSGYLDRLGKLPRCHQVFPHHRFVTGNAVTWSYWKQDSSVFRGFQDLFAGAPPMEGHAGDSIVLDRMIARLRDVGDPVFAVAMLNATHFKYDFDSADVRFRPYWNSQYDLMKLDSSVARSIHNRYRNAAYSVDRRLRGFFGELRRMGLDRNSVVIVTGDHGEEFFETGRLSHTSDANSWQTRVPLVIVDSGLAGRIRYPTSHSDLLRAAAILAAAGDSSPPLRSILFDRSEGVVAFNSTPLPDHPGSITAWVGSSEIRVQLQGRLPMVIAREGPPPPDLVIRRLGPVIQQALNGGYPRP